MYFRPNVLTNSSLLSNVHVVIVHIANHQEIISTKSFLFHKIVNSWLHFLKERPIGLKIRKIKILDAFQNDLLTFLLILVC